MMAGADRSVGRRTRNITIADSTKYNYNRQSLGQFDGIDIVQGVQ